MADEFAQAYTYLFYVVLQFAPGATAAQWKTLEDGVNDTPSRFFSQLRNHADGDPASILEFHKLNLAGTECLTGARVSFANKDAVLAELDTYAAQYGVTGSVSAKFSGVLQNELQQVGTALGYGAALVAQLLVTQLWFSQDESANADARAWLTAHGVNWYA